MARPQINGRVQPNTGCARPQPPRLVELRAIFKILPDGPLLARLRAYRPAAGRPSYPVRAMWRAHVACYVLNLSNTNALIRELEDDPALRRLCGFSPRRPLPHRRTFNRFIRRLSDHDDLVEAVFTGVVNELKTLLPDMGEVVAIDGTMVSTHADPRRDTDTEAGWGVSHSSRSRRSDGVVLEFGYKLHALGDTAHDLPLAVTVTTGSRHDSPELPPLVAKAKGMYDWLKPKVAVADRGYDAASNHQALWFEHEIIPVIHMRKPSSRGDGLRQGVYTAQGEPTCTGGVAMEYVGTNKKGIRLYRCRAAGCPLKDTASGGVRYCDGEYRLDPNDNIWLHGVIRRRGKQ